MFEYTHIFFFYQKTHLRKQARAIITHVWKQKYVSIKYPHHQVVFR